MYVSLVIVTSGIRLSNLYQGLYQVGGFLATLTVTYFADKWGRKAGIAVVSRMSSFAQLTLLTMSSLLSFASYQGHSSPVLPTLESLYSSDLLAVLGKLLHYQGSGEHSANVHSAFMILAAVPIWMTEVVPPASRGILVDIHGACLLFGYAFANWIGFTFYFLTDNPNAWRAPLGKNYLHRFQPAFY
jgi:MFS family permease